MGVIWQDELARDQRRREWAAFYCGLIVATVVILGGALIAIQLTGGFDPPECTKEASDAENRLMFAAE